MDKLIVSVPEAAALLGVSDDLVYELTARGDLPCIRPGPTQGHPAAGNRIPRRTSSHRL